MIYSVALFSVFLLEFFKSFFSGTNFLSGSEALSYFEEDPALFNVVRFI